MPPLRIVRRLPGPLRRPIVGAADILRAFLVRRAEDTVITPDPAQRERAARLHAIATRPACRHVGTRVAVAGLFGTRCGLQRGAELMVLDLQARGVDVLAIDLAPGLNTPLDLQTTATADLDQLARFRPTDLIVHLNPPEYASALALFPPAALQGVTLVGYWAWELTVVSQDWRDCARLCDEIWTPSPFVAQAMATGIPDYHAPIRVVPHAVDRAPMTAPPAAERPALRARFGLPEHAFVVATSFSFASSYARKNPCGAIDAFRAAFRDPADPDAQPVRLVVRCNDTAAHRRLFLHLQSYAGDDPRILVWDNAVTGCRIRELYGLIDAYISLHRSEGYGLTLAEAAQTGAEVVATAWSLAPDIAARPQLHQVAYRLVLPLDSEGFYERYPGAVWAEPDILDAAARLRECHAAWRTRRLPGSVALAQECAAAPA